MGYDKNVENVGSCHNFDQSKSFYMNPRLEEYRWYKLFHRKENFGQEYFDPDDYDEKLLKRLFRHK